jgi:hypothetical protein
LDNALRVDREKISDMDGYQIFQLPYENGNGEGNTAAAVALADPGPSHAPPKNLGSLLRHKPMTPAAG